MIDLLPEIQMISVINMLEGLGELSVVNVHPKFTPNTETLEAFAETEDFFAMLDAEE